MCFSSLHITVLDITHTLCSACTKYKTTKSETDASFKTACCALLLQGWWWNHFVVCVGSFCAHASNHRTHLIHPHIIRAETGPYQRQGICINSFFTDIHSLPIVAKTLSYGLFVVPPSSSVLVEMAFSQNLQLKSWYSVVFVMALEMKKYAHRCTLTDLKSWLCTQSHFISLKFILTLYA